jgi:hypothetical protein
MIGTHTYIYRHKHRPQVYGSLIEVRSHDDDPTHTAYGQYINFINSNDNGAVSYGIYSRVPEAKDHAGYFDGNVTVTGNFVNNSDARLKKNIERIDRAIDVVMQLQPRQYQFLEGNRFSYSCERMHFGFLAQDLEKVLPALVHDIAHPPVLEPVAESAEEERRHREDNGGLSTTVKSKKVDGVLDTTTTALKRIKIGKQEYTVAHEAQMFKGVRYNDLIAVLTGAIQEQQGMIEELGAEISDLKQELEELRECTKCRESSQFPKMRSTSSDSESDVKSISGSQSLASPINSIVIYPNPATNEITISTTEGTTIRAVNTYDSVGKLIVSYKPNSMIFQMNTSRWLNGNYIIEVLDDAQVLERHIVSILK